MALDADQRARFVSDGYLLLPGAIDARRVRGARRAIARSLERDQSVGQLRKFTSDTFCPDATREPAITALLEPLRPVIAELFGADAPPRAGTPQIALRFPQLDRGDARHGFHLDGFPNALNGVPADSIFRHTLLAGVYLTPLRGPDRGNFVLWPGSHRHFAELFEAIDVARVLRERGAEEVLRRVRAESLGDSVQLEAEPGDAILAHHLLAHGTVDNLSVRTREAVYFRVVHPEHDPRDPGSLRDVSRFFDGLRW
jgi:hypothetical protein